MPWSPACWPVPLSPVPSSPCARSCHVSCLPEYHSHAFAAHERRARLPYARSSLREKTGIGRGELHGVVPGATVVGGHIGHDEPGAERPGHLAQLPLVDHGGPV